MAASGQNCPNNSQTCQLITATKCQQPAGLQLDESQFAFVHPYFFLSLPTDNKRKQTY